jgi:hypothetical protein
VVYTECVAVTSWPKVPSIAVLRNKKYLVGLAAGSLWLILVESAFAVWALVTVRTSVATSLAGATGALAFGLIFFGVVTIRAALSLPAVDDAAPSDVRRIRHQFWMAVGAECVGCAVVSVVSVATHHWLFIVPLNLIIVGLHFLPLARLFAVPRYYVLGAMFCLIPTATMLFIPKSGHIGSAWSWVFLSSTSCGLMALLTGWKGLDEVRRARGTR